jgi:broad specificity phosphatase PhoE
MLPNITTPILSETVEPQLGINSRQHPIQILMSLMLAIGSDRYSVPLIIQGKGSRGWRSARAGLPRPALKAFRQMTNKLTPKAAFYFLRHGETDWNRAGRLQGATDIPLNGLGVQQAAEAARILASQPIERVAMSQLTRVRQTAEPLLKKTGLVPEIHTGLAERRYGVWEGKTQSEIDLSRPPSGGETRPDFHARVISTVQTLVTGPGLLLIAHGGVFRAIAAGLGIELGRGIGNAQPVRFDFDTQTGRWNFSYILADFEAIS